MEAIIGLCIFILSFGVYSSYGQDLDFGKPKFAEPTSCKRSSSLLFQSDSVVDIQVVTNFKRFNAIGYDEKIYIPATLSYLNDDSTYVTLNVKIRPRGHFRRQKDVCRMPPILVNFKKEEVDQTLFGGQNKLKLVTHCRLKKSDEENLLSEYLAYKIYNSLTPFSYKVRLLNIRYVDSSGRSKPLVRHGFFIESVSEFEKRNCVSYVNLANIHQESVDSFQMTLISIFQYLIGNTDWSVAARHNIDLFVGNSSKPLIPVTYDFDFSGLVDATYAQPQPMLGIHHVTDRLYRGYERTGREFYTVLDLFNKQHKLILDLSKELPFPFLVEKNRKLKYLEQFFNEIQSPAMVKRVFFDGSRKIQ